MSSTGDGLAAVAFPLLAVGLTRDVRLIAGVAAASRLPWLVCSLPAGALVDRRSPRHIVAATEALRALLLVGTALAVLLHATTLPLLYLVAFTVGTCETAFSAAIQATIPAVVAEEGLARANGRMYTAQLGGELFLGPALGGLAFALSPALPFLGDGISFAVCGGLLLATLPRRLPGADVSPARTSTLRADMREGVIWFASHRLIRLIAAVVASMAMFQAMVNGVAVVYAVHVLHLSKSGFGLFIALGSTGNIFGGMIAGRIKDRWGTGRVLIGAGLVAAGCYVIVGLTSTTAVAVGAFVVECLVVVVGNVANLSLRQALVPPELRGRLSNLFRMVVYGAIPLGAAVGGVVAEAVGVRTAIVIAGAAQVAVLAATSRSLFRQLAVHEPAAAPGPLAAAA